MKSNTFRRILILAVMTFLFFVLYSLIFQNSNLSATSDTILMLRARELMGHVIETIRKEREERDLTIDKTIDPNGTGLIGREYTPLTTTLGHLEAKRTTVNPDTAAMICGIFLEAGLNPGDSVAIGSSASFPGLLIATLSACRVLELNPITFISVGASQYGANNPDFTIIDQMKLLEREFGAVFVADAASMGGNNDIADDLEEDIRQFILGKIRTAGYRLIHEKDFEQNVRVRMELYDELSRSPVKLFINIGGAEANMGTSFEVLNLEPGMNRQIETIPPKEQRGVIYAYAARQVPVLHLLYVKGLCLKYGLLWDPIPFSEDSYKSLTYFHEENDAGYLVFYICYSLCSVSLCCFWLIQKYLKNKRN